jgi:hypothetical protein
LDIPQAQAGLFAHYGSEKWSNTVPNKTGFPLHSLWKLQPLLARQGYLQAPYQKRLDTLWVPFWRPRPGLNEQRHNETCQIPHAAVSCCQGARF